MLEPWDNTSFLFPNLWWSLLTVYLYIIIILSSISHHNKVFIVSLAMFHLLLNCENKLNLCTSLLQQSFTPVSHFLLRLSLIPEPCIIAQRRFGYNLCDLAYLSNTFRGICFLFHFFLEYLHISASVMFFDHLMRKIIIYHRVPKSVLVFAVQYPWFTRTQWYQW